MTTILWLCFALYFWPTDGQMQYCMEAQYSQEQNNDMIEKEKICNLIIDKNMKWLNDY